MLENIKAVIFDLDGTLVDSMWMWKDIDVEFLGAYGHDCPEDLQKAIEGMSFSETAAYFKKRFSLPIQEDEIKDMWVRMSIGIYRTRVPLKPGAKELLLWLKSKNILTGIATSNSRDMVDAVLDSLDAKQYFNQITTACEVAAGKPSPDIYLKVAADLKVAPKDCLVFEDIPAGILSGKRAGMKVCAVYDDFSRHMNEEKRELSDYFIRDFGELLRMENGL